MLRQSTTVVLVLLALAAPALAAPALAQGSADSVEDCEQLQGFDEYNRCLARFGPPANAIGAGTARPPRGVDPAAETATSSAAQKSPPAAKRRATVRRASAEPRVRGGRKSASFTVVTGRGSAKRATRDAKPVRRRR